MRTVNRRATRQIGAVTGALALLIGLSTVLPTAAAEAVTEPDTQGTSTSSSSSSDTVEASDLGAPTRLLIENMHAAGKVLEIGNDSAQKTEPDSTPAAAAIFARGTTPATLSAQLITAYPVTGASDTYVFANADGEVLVRNANDNPLFRYLSISAKTPTEAADDPNAQWKTTDAGDGAVYITNVQRDGNGRVPRTNDVTVPTRSGGRPGRIYEPKGRSSAVVLFLHGGGWVLGDLEMNDSLCRDLALASGTTLLSLDYRLAPEHPFPAALDDASDALEWMATGANGRVDTVLPLAVAGHSAGGNLAAVLARRSRDGILPPIAHQLLLCPFSTTTSRGRRTLRTPRACL